MNKITPALIRGLDTILGFWTYRVFIWGEEHNSVSLKCGSACYDVTFRKYFLGNWHNSALQVLSHSPRDLNSARGSFSDVWTSRSFLRGMKFWKSGNVCVIDRFLSSDTLYWNHGISCLLWLFYEYKYSRTPTYDFPTWPISRLTIPLNQHPLYLSSEFSDLQLRTRISGHGKFLQKTQELSDHSVPCPFQNLR
jgi:hypothetical protein